MQARLFNNAQALMQNNCQKTCKTTFYILHLHHQSARIGRSRYLHYKKDGRSPRKGTPNFFYIRGLLVKIGLIGQNWAYWSKLDLFNPVKYILLLQKVHRMLNHCEI